MPDDRASDWYLMDHQVTEGPLSESEMRARLKSSPSATMKVKQGNSDWYLAEDVRRKIDRLELHGIYFRYLGTHEGPFTLTKAHQLLEATGVAGIEIRTGSKGKWVSADRWLRTVQRLRDAKRQWPRCRGDGVDDARLRGR